MLWQHIRYWITQISSSSQPAVEQGCDLPEAISPERPVAEVISFWRYHAALSVYTPLSHLHKDGQERRHNPANLQLVSNPDQSHGAWIAYRADGFIAFSELSQGQIDNLIAEAGAEREQKLRFLIRFREIFESKVLHVDQKLMQIYALADKPEFAKPWQSVQANNFPDNVFIADLTKLKGIGSQKALLLWTAGLRTPAMVQAASDQDLLAIRGIGPKLITRIRAQTAA
jgi:hypothetical protein